MRTISRPCRHAREMNPLSDCGRRFVPRVSLQDAQAAGIGTTAQRSEERSQE